MCQALFRNLLFFWTLRHYISYPTSCNHVESALGWPSAWPSHCTPSLTNNVRGNLATWGMALGKSPGVFTHCFWLENKTPIETAKGPDLLGEHDVLSCLQGHFLDKQLLCLLCLLDFWPCKVTVRQNTSQTNEPVKWGNSGFRWMLFLSPRQCWLGFGEQEVVNLTHYCSLH